MGLDENQNPLSTSKTLKNIFTFLVHQSAISNISSTTSLIFNQKNNFNINISAHDLNNVRISLYSSCMAFDNSLFYFSSLNKTTSLDTSVFVNCKPGSADLSLTLQSDELNAQIPLGVYVKKIPQSNLELEFLSPSIYSSKDNLQIKLTNNKEPAEKLYLTVLPTPTIRSSDMLYLGDFQDERIAYVQVQVQEVGNQPISVEARWVENGVPFTKVWQKVITVTQKPPAQIPSSFIASIIGLVILCIIWMTYSKTSISFFKKG
jgi:hypothetical protein